MNDASLIALFSVGMASTLTVLFLAFRRTFRQEQERILMRRMRRRLDLMFLKQNVPEAKAVKKASLITVSLQCWPCR